MKIYDCFSYWDEDLLLDLRLNILNEYVDYFVIVEGNKTWQNNPKKLRFNIDKFPNFKKKIIYVPVEDMPDGDDPYLRENFQRNCILRGLKYSSDDDLIIISDLDEIPNPSKIHNFEKKKICSF
jgi:beta-1,4-mannosyl-glycoprotein beta-1,4-N-acetylglucosaminyltransferase